LGVIRETVVNWPAKSEREPLEIAGFIEAYARLPGSPQLAVVARGEKPDYVVEDARTKTQYGVELTSVYSDDFSVARSHKAAPDVLVHIPFNEEELRNYENRLVVNVVNKVCKARQSYDVSRPLILSVYVNEYIAIYLGEAELNSLVQRYSAEFDSVSPFAEVVFWNLGNGGVFRVMPTI
jgi:hypothetical protein